MDRPQPARLGGVERWWPRRHRDVEVDACLAEIARMNELTDKPFGVNLPLLFTREPRVVDLVAKSGVRFVTTSAGSPANPLA